MFSVNFLIGKFRQLLHTLNKSSIERETVINKFFNYRHDMLFYYFNIVNPINKD